jgi:hypothetical protein
MLKPNSSQNLAKSMNVVSDPAIIRRVEITCELFNLAFEMKYLELKRRNPDAGDDWLRAETLQLIALGAK